MLPLILQLARDHQAAIIFTLVPVLSALITAVFRPRTPEDFLRYGVRVGALHKVFAGFLVDAPKAADALMLLCFAPSTKERSAALVSLIAAVTLDPRKIGEGLLQLVTGRDLYAPPPPPANDNDRGDPPIPPALLVGVPFFLLLAACRPAETPREQARGAILTIAFAVRAANEACATVAERTRDVELAATCADAFDAAKDSLIAAESTVDAWDRGAAGDISCAASRGVAALTSIVSAVRTAGGNLPPVVDDALRLAPLVTGVCRG